MKIIKIIPGIFIICLLFSFSSSQRWLDFCVADFKRPYNPAGYPCKDPSTVSANDFFGPGVLNAPDPNTFYKIFKLGMSPAYVGQVPGLNGEHVSMARTDYQPGGVAAFHTHPDATQIVTVLEGNMTVGFISTNNTGYIKSISKGDIFVIPKALLHFHINSGKTQLLTIEVYNSANPTLQIGNYALFANNISTQLISKITFISLEEVKRLKKLFGGSG